MPETQFLFFTKWQEQKRRKFNIDPYMLIQETGIQKIRKQEFRKSENRNSKARNGLLQNN